MAKRRAPKKSSDGRPRRRTEPAETTRSTSPPANETPRPAPPKGGRPWWLAIAVVLVIAVVAAVRLGEGARTEGQDVTDMDLDSPPPPPEQLRVRVVRRHPHDPGAFTQGLVWHDGYLYESTGLRGRSTLRKVDLETGEVLQRRDVDRAHFAEGLALVGDQLVQLTWRNGIAHVWSLDGFEHRRTFEYDGEGWGLCYDGRNLVMSDGTARLTFRDPRTFRAVRQVTVRRNGRAVADLNELECAGGAVWANVWQSEEILRIDPASGRVTGVVDARGLLSDAESLETDVLNGIAWIPERQRFVITGKLWPHLFEVEFVPREVQSTAP